MIPGTLFSAAERGRIKKKKKDPISLTNHNRERSICVKNWTKRGFKKKRRAGHGSEKEKKDKVRTKEGKEICSFTVAKGN